MMASRFELRREQNVLPVTAIRLKVLWQAEFQMSPRNHMECPNNRGSPWSGSILEWPCCWISG